MDYRYLLYFERDARFDVLERLAGMASPTAEGPTTLVLPNRTVELPFGTWSKPQRSISWDDAEPSWDFMTVLCFPPDGPIEDYLLRQRMQSAGQDPSPYDDEGRARLGIIYLTVESGVDSGTGEQLASFAFGTPGSTMSILFWESESIRDTMVGLLEDCRGVYGVFDREDEADLFWFRGERRDDELPTADLSLAEIEELVPPRRQPATEQSPGEGSPAPQAPVAPLPLSFAAEQVVVAAKHQRRVGRGTELCVNHWQVALHEEDDGPAALHYRQALAHGDLGRPLPEDEVRDHATRAARQEGRSLVSAEDIRTAVHDAELGR